MNRLLGQMFALTLTLTAMCLPIAIAAGIAVVVFRWLVSGACGAG